MVLDSNMIACSASDHFQIETGYKQTNKPAQTNTNKQAQTNKHKLTNKHKQTNRQTNKEARLIDYLRFYVPLKNISLIWRRHHCR
jgi:hypothetical protein